MGRAIGTISPVPYNIIFGPKGASGLQQFKFCYQLDAWDFEVNEYQSYIVGNPTKGDY